MQAIIWSEGSGLIQVITNAIKPYISEPIVSREYGDLKTPAKVAKAQRDLERVHLLVVDASTGLNLTTSWALGAAFTVGLPTVVLWQQGQPCDFGPLRHVVSVVETIPLLVDAVSRVTTGVQGGQEAYVQAATKLHLEYLERIGK